MQALTSAALSSIISSIYRTSFEEDDFGLVFEKIQTMIGCRFIFSADWNHCTSAYSKTWLRGDLNARALRAYDDYREEIYHQDPMIAHIQSTRPAPIASSISVIGSDRYLEQPYVRWSADQLGSTYWTLLHESDPVSTSSKLGMAIHCDRSSGPLNKLLLSQLTLVVEQIGAAQHLYRMHMSPATANKAVFNVSLDGNVLAMTPQAETLVASGTVCAIIGGKLSFRRNDRLAWAIGRTGRERLCAWCNWHMEADGKHWTVKVRFAQANSIGPPGLIVTIEDQAAMREAHTARWSANFRLTLAEANLAYVLAKEVSNLPQAAARIGISYNTARTHLAHIMAKTQCASQTELISLLFDL